ncbi:hypothetical protein ACWGR4_22565 [Embleya sp. NPDC055664]
MVTTTRAVAAGRIDTGTLPWQQAENEIRLEPVDHAVAFTGAVYVILILILILIRPNRARLRR